MKYCRNCGNELCDEAVICPKCGCSVDNMNMGLNQSQPSATSEKYSVMCILGFVFAFIESVVGLVLSIIAYNEAKNSDNKKSLTLSKAGIIVSSVMLGASALLVVFYMFFFFFSLAFGGLYLM